MKRFAFCLVVILALSGCKIKRHAVIDTDEHYSSVYADTSSFSSVVSSASSDSVWSQFISQRSSQAHIVVYDTSAPVDSSTGKHPVKIEADFSSSSASSSSSGAITQSLTDVSTQAISVSSTDVEHNVRTIEDDDFSSSTHFSWNIIIFFAIMAACGIASIIIKKP